ncbi:MAG: hypothetical protein AAF514_00685 [Verrucomicrobiota bacterium]
MIPKLIKTLLPLSLVLILGTQCSREKETSGDAGAAAQPAPKAASTGELVLPSKPLPGKDLNPFFPSDEGEFDVVFTMERSGFAQAKLNQDGKELASLAITDTASVPAAIDKFRNASDSLGGYPLAKSGSKGTAILVGNQFQVVIRSKDESFGEEDRKQWLQKFDLKALAGKSSATGQLNPKKAA